MGLRTEEKRKALQEPVFRVNHLVWHQYGLIASFGRFA